MSIIETKDLTKYYLGGKILGCKDLNLNIEEGEIFGFLGPNGAGKSTTIRLLLDMIRPTSGSAKIFNKDVNKKTVEIKKEIGYLPGEIYLPEKPTGGQVINYYSGFKKKVDQKYLNTLIERFEFDASRKVKNYSKGNKQKLSIILAFMHKPKLLIFDEPTSGLDPLNQQEFYKTVLDAKKDGATVFFSTHILDEAEKICDRIGIIRKGLLTRVESVDDFKDSNIRKIVLETKKSIPLTKLNFEGVKKIARTTRGYQLTIEGRNVEIMKKLVNLDVEDISTTESSLEDTFLEYYENGDKDV